MLITVVCMHCIATDVSSVSLILSMTELIILNKKNYKYLLLIELEGRTVS